VLAQHLDLVQKHHGPLAITTFQPVRQQEPSQLALDLGNVKVVVIVSEKAGHVAGSRMRVLERRYGLARYGFISDSQSAYDHFHFPSVPRWTSCHLDKKRGPAKA
jgi:hypothetical protein